MSAILIALLRTTGESRSDAAPSARVFRVIRTWCGSSSPPIVVCALSGYLPLARFLGQQLIVTGSILALVYLLLLWVDGFVQGLGDEERPSGDGSNAAHASNGASGWRCRSAWC